MATDGERDKEIMSGATRSRTQSSYVRTFKASIFDLTMSNVSISPPNDPGGV